MAEVIWKELVWTGSTRDTSIKELLTILKGYGPTEVLHFERPGAYSGALSIWLDESGVKQLTIFHLEVTGEKRRGTGRNALEHLRRIFAGEIYAQNPGSCGGIHVEQPNLESALFWIKMFEEKMVQSVEGDLMYIDEVTSSDELADLKVKYSLGCKSGYKSI